MKNIERYIYIPPTSLNWMINIFRDIYYYLLNATNYTIILTHYARIKYERTVCYTFLIGNIGVYVGNTYLVPNEYEYII